MPYTPKPRYLAAFVLGLLAGIALSLAINWLCAPQTPREVTQLRSSTSIEKTWRSAGISNASSRCRIEVVNGSVILLPMPKVRRGSMPIEVALAYRRSLRHYLPKPITLEQLSQLLWAADGINNPWTGFRTAPSAGATYPIDIYVVVGERSVEICPGKYLEPGSYLYDPHTHSLKLVRKGDLRKELARAALDQEWVEKAAVDIVLCAVFERTTKYYGERGYRYVYMEAGHIGQNIYLEATALGLGTVAVGAFYDEEVREVIGARPSQHPIYIFPVGVPEKPYRVTQQEIDEYIASERSKLKVGS